MPRLSKKEPTVQFSIRLLTSERDALSAIAEELGIMPSVYIRMVLKQHLAEQQKQNNATP